MADLPGTRCAIYARVSTREQAEEGYSIAAQLKAIREFCSHEGLEIAAEFVEAESAGKVGRSQFNAMCEFFTGNPDVRLVVAHKLDRLTRNFSDALRLEEIGVKDRYVISDFPEGPAGELARDVNLAVAKHYVNNLRQEVKKGMEEKVAQGGWPHKAPVGYLNDRTTRGIVPDPLKAPLIAHAFERYASGLVSLADLAEELTSLGLRSRAGNPIIVSALDKMLKNPIYCGRIRYRGAIYPGAHEPLVSVELFERVQEAFAPNRTKNNAQKRSYALRDFLTCGECGAKITAGTHKGHVYYRCTHGKGDCSQRSYIREAALTEEVASLLAQIEIDDEIVAALVEAAEAIASQGDTRAQARCDLEAAIRANKTRASALLDRLLDGVVDSQTYRAKADELESEIRALELRLSDLDRDNSRTSAQVEALARIAQGARMDFERGDLELKRRTLSHVLCNATVQEGHIASYQYKDPFGVLVKSPEGAFLNPWWAIQDLNL